MNLDTRAGAPAEHGWWKGDQDQVGMYLHGYESLWLPASLLQADAQSRLADALVAASRHKEVGLHFNKGLAGAPAAAVSAALDTAMNPAATTAFALAIIADGEAPAYPGMPDARVHTEAARTRRAVDRCRHGGACPGCPAAAAPTCRRATTSTRTGSAPTSAGTMRSLRQ